MRDAKPHSFAINGKAARHPIIPIIESVRFQRAKGLFHRASQGWARVFCVAPNDHAAAPGNKILQAAESQLISLKIRVYVGVMLFEGRDDQGLEMVMKKFQPSVPESAFIFVAV